MQTFIKALNIYGVAGKWPKYILTIPVKQEFTPLQIIEVRHK